MGLPMVSKLNSVWPIPDPKPQNLTNTNTRYHLCMLIEIHMELQRFRIDPDFMKKFDGEIILDILLFIFY